MKTFVCGFSDRVQRSVSSASVAHTSAVTGSNTIHIEMATIKSHKLHIDATQTNKSEVKYRIGDIIKRGSRGREIKLWDAMPAKKCCLVRGCVSTECGTASYRLQHLLPTKSWPKNISHREIKTNTTYHQRRSYYNNNKTKKHHHQHQQQTNCIELAKCVPRSLRVP